MKFKILSLLFALSIFIFQSCKVKQVVNSKTPEEIKVVEEVKPPTGIKIGTTEIPSEELEMVLKTALQSDTTYLDSLIGHYVTIKRMAMDHDPKSNIVLDYEGSTNIEDEVNTYKRIIAKEYFLDKKELENLKQEALEHMKYEINASHIFIYCPEFASKEDTSVAYEKIKRIQVQLKNHGKFEETAKLFSEDKLTKENGGNFGWFSSLQLIYPLEKIIYKTPVNTISDIVRTPLGYHIIKVNDRRANSGTVWVKHISKLVEKPEDNDISREVLVKVYNDLKLGISFDQLCEIYSDDPYAKYTHGSLPPFSIGSREEAAFEEAAFKLKEGEFSFPIRSKTGWHIIQMIKRKPFEVNEELERKVEAKIVSHSRGEEIEKRSIDKLRKELNLRVNSNAKEEALSMLNNKIKTLEWDYNSTGIKNQEIMKIDGKSFFTNDFLLYLKERQNYYKEGETIHEFGARIFYEFKKETLTEEGADILEKNNKDFKYLIQFYRDEILAKDYIKRNVYEKVNTDSLGQQNYYDKHINKYQTQPYAQLTLISYKNQEVKEAYDKQTLNDAPYSLRRGIKPIYFSKNEAILSEGDKAKLIGLIQIMNSNPHFIVEIGGHADLNESDGISLIRVQNIVNFLVSSGLDITRIREFDYQKYRIEDRFDWSQNQRASFEFYSTSEIDLMKLINRKYEGGIQMKRGRVYQSNLDKLGDFEWKLGKQLKAVGGRLVEIDIHEINNTNAKKFKDVQGQVILDYQESETNKIMQQLRAKYPVNVIDSKYVIFEK